MVARNGKQVRKTFFPSKLGIHDAFLSKPPNFEFDQSEKIWFFQNDEIAKLPTGTLMV